MLRMNYMIYEVDKLPHYIPPEYKGYTYIKTARLFIPYKEVGLSILERKEIALSLMFETVLSLIESGVNDINSMSIFLGVDVDVYKEIIAQMEFEDLISISEYIIRITPHGKNSLESLKKIVTNKTQLNQIMVDLITGEIQDNEYRAYYNRPQQNCPYLDGTISIDIDYFREKISVLQSIYFYNKQAEGIELSNSPQIETLYRVLDIVYDKIVYLPQLCYVYINNEDKSLLFTCEDKKYDEVISTQFLDSIPGALYLFESESGCYKYNYSINSQSLKNNLLQLTATLKERERKIIDADEIKKLYYSDRALLDGELRDMLRGVSENNPQKVIVLSCRMKSFFQDNVLIDELISTTPRSDILFMYSPSEYKIGNSIEYIKSRLSTKEVGRVNFIELPSYIELDHTLILSYPGYVILEYYEILLTKPRNSKLLKSVAYISFDSQCVTQADHLIMDFIDEI